MIRKDDKDAFLEELARKRQEKQNKKREELEGKPVYKDSQVYESD